MEEDEGEIYSYHTFMLPFVFTEKLELKNNWNYQPFNINNPKDYNEFVYFYKHVQNALFNKDANIKENSISQYYEYTKEKGVYTISCIKGDFILEIDGISLRVFNTKVAILAFNLKNTKYKNPEEVLAINDFGRRIYPQFLGKDDFTESTKKAILANSLTLSFEREKPLSENFEKYNDLNYLKIEKLNLLPSFIETLIGNNFTNIRPIIDDRMFVVSQYNNDALVAKLKFYKKHENAYEYEQNDFWYKYIFVDGDDKTSQSKHMSKKLIAESTYDRWVEWGTLFGISRYSFVALTGSWFGKNRLLPHMQTMYFQMFSLLLAYRASIIKFSDDIQNATDENKENIAEEARILYKNYLNFLNKLYFKEITAQEQGIELYSQAMKLMSIEKYMSNLDNVIKEFHSYVDLIEEQKRTKFMDRISLLGSYLLLPALLTGFFGMNIIDFDLIKGKFDNWVYVGFGVSVFIVPIGFWVLNKIKKSM